MKRLLKFLFIAAPFVVVYFLSILMLILGLTDKEAASVGIPVIASICAIASVLIVTWASGFWGRWWFPISFALVPFLIFIDLIVSSAIGIQPMLITLACLLVLSIVGTLKEAAHNKSQQHAASRLDSL